MGLRPIPRYKVRRFAPYPSQGRRSAPPPCETWDETLGEELRALGEGLRALAGAQGGEHADERGGKVLRTSDGPVSAP